MNKLKTYEGFMDFFKKKTYDIPEGDKSITKRFTEFADINDMMQEFRDDNPNLYIGISLATLNDKREHICYLKGIEEFNVSLVPDKITNDCYLIRIFENPETVVPYKEQRKAVDKFLNEKKDTFELDNIKVIRFTDKCVNIGIIDSVDFLLY